MNPTFAIGKTTFKVLKLRKSTYINNDTTAVTVVTEFTDEGTVQIDRLPISVNLAQSINLPPDTFFAKSYSECKACYNALVAAGWLKPTGQVAQTGFVSVPACTIGPNANVE
jgi:hypothetical protein